MKQTIMMLWLILVISSQAFALQAGGVTSEVLAKTGQSWDGQTLPSYPSGTPEITMLRITIPPGVTLPVHHHPVINAGVLVSGELTVITENNKTLHLKSGDAIVEVVNTPHYGRNDGDQPAVIVVFYAGTQGAPLTVLDGAPAPKEP
jgi:quercetin dioxygenase-like cupin family protein